ncbi:2-oxoglutarate (2OG) and Fe(II)-dependent oxygenase superfamily protein [Thalictrum thalictroides]|uniref:2-oxoglutarate (2OG) and Fe(II)-dependent oxygenase superfamily protein n=1 Tax=Thalictrum thalictroides TaxID=46969 RepID=A0A7J6W1G5_THATH|nr:2-oxoglutarate (2OG) and Fe(II)-dependent oxygenase superfamily protein [Thalictrum thalictroides]
MSDSLKDFGGSLPVPNVQELANKELKDIPDRYVRSELESGDVVPIDNSIEIPVFDLSKLLDQQVGNSNELAMFHSACKDWGFFQLTNHGVPEEIIEKMKSDTMEFFNLPFEEKKAYGQMPNHMEGYGQAFVMSEEQKLDWSDMHFLIANPLINRDMRFWPKTPTSFRETMDKYTKELRKVTISLIGLMAKNLGLEPEKLTTLFEDCIQGVRMNYYPPCPHADKVLGISPHSDGTALTLLIQVNQVQGLQVKKNGKWVPIKPIPGAFVVNIGDVLEIMSNGIYKSNEHRAVINSHKERLSIAAFHDPEFGTIMGPLPDLVKGDREKYRTVSQADFFRLVINNKLDGKSSLEVMKI